MDAADRESLKEQLKVMTAGREEGIGLDSREHWAVAEVRDPVLFFRHLAVLIPEDSILYFEGVSLAPAAVSLYRANRARDAICVARETIYPVPEVFHVSMGRSVVAGLLELLRTHLQPSCFIHVKAYQDGKLVFSFHDAFDGSELLISDRVSEEAVRAFCKEVGGTLRREPNENKQDPEVLTALLRALEHPEKARFLWPWWKRALFFWKK